MGKTGIGVGGAFVLVIVFILASCSACGYAAKIDGDGLRISQPMVDAQAMGAAQAVDLSLAMTAQWSDYQATREASSAQATATVAAAQAEATRQAGVAQLAATRTALAQMADATATAVPWQAAKVENKTQTDLARNWLTTLVGVGGGLLVLVSLGFGLAAWLHTQARTVRTPTGVLIREGSTWIDPGRQLGPAVTVQRPDQLYNLARAKHLLQTGELLPAQETRVGLTDGGATADHYLPVAAANERTKGLEATFRKPDPTMPKEKKIEALRGKRRDTPQLETRMPKVVVVQDEEQIANFERKLLGSGGDD